MSVYARFWSEDGYGIDVESLTVEPQKLKEFVLKHYKSVDDNLLADFKLDVADSEESFAEAFSEYEDSDGQISFFAFVAEAMHAETEISFVFCKGTDYGEAIMVCPKYMWSAVSEKERKATRDDLDKIFMAYAEELGICGPKINYQEINYHW